jgi:DnaJ like chaperone protein
MKQWLLSHLGKVLGAALGFLLLRLPGLAIGLLLGYVIDILRQDEGGGSWFEKHKTNEEVDPNDFMVGAIILAAAIIKVDEKVDMLELTYVHRFLTDQFGEETANAYEPVLHKALQEPFDLKATTVNIRRSTSYETRLQLLYLLFGIAKADYHTDDKEVAMIETINLHLGLPKSDFEAIKAMFYEEIDAYYKILEVMPSASDEQVKEGYRRMSMKFHPDKLAHLGPAIEKAAKHKFQRVQQAYEAICKERGIRP